MFWANTDIKKFRPDYGDNVEAMENAQTDTILELINQKIKNASDEASRKNLEDVKIRYSNSKEAPDLTGLVGAPWGYTGLADLKTKNGNSSETTSYGEVYFNNIIADSTLIAFRVGRPKFTDEKLFGNSKTENGLIKAASESLKSVVSKATIKNLSRVLKDDLYSFRDEHATYWSMVSTIMKFVTTQVMDVTNDEMYAITGTKGPASKYAWGAASTDYLQNRFAAVGKDGETGNAQLNVYIPFLHDGPIQVTESVNNEVGPSFVEELFNSKGSDTAKEIAFLSNKYVGVANNGKLKAKESSGKLSKFIKGSQNAFGISMTLPNVWKGASFDRSYTVAFNITVPYGDKCTFIKDILLPTVMAMTLATPVAAEYLNSISAPWLIQCFSPGTVKCNLGMVTAFNIERVAESLSSNGFPTSVKLTLTIQDLDAKIGLPEHGLLDDSMDLSHFNNTALPEFFSGFTGYNMDDKSITSLIKDKYEGFIGSVYSKITLAGIRRKASNFGVNFIEDIKNDF